MSNLSKLSEAKKVESLVSTDTLFGIRYDKVNNLIEEIQIPVPNVFDLEDNRIPDIKFSKLIAYPNMDKNYPLDSTILSRMIKSNSDIKISAVIKIKPSLSITGGKLTIRFKNSFDEYIKIELVDIIIDENDHEEYIYIPLETTVYNLDEEGLVGTKPMKILIHNDEVIYTDLSDKLITRDLDFNYTTDINLTNASGNEFELINLKISLK